MIDFDRPYLIGSNGERVQADIRREQAEGCFRFSMQLPQAAQLREVVLFSGAHGFSPDAPFYGDGYQKLSQYRGTLAKFDSITGYTDRDHYKMPQTDGFSTVYNYALIGTGAHTVLIGAASCNRFRTEIRVNGRQIQIVQCLEDLAYPADEPVALEDMVLLKGEKNAIVKKFARLIGKNHPPKKYFEMPVGWCSWYCIGPNISEKLIFENLRVIKQKTPQLKYIQIDDGFQPFMGDWLETSDKFDRPMREICADIKKAGFEPAIWLAPFIASPKSRLLREHSEYFVQDAAGRPLCSDRVTFGGWRDGPWYMLDGTHPGAQQYIYDVVREIYEDWGVRYYKLDANVWGGLPFGVRYDKNATAVEAYRRGMDALWKAVHGEAFILGCNAPMWPSLGEVTAMRVTNDVIRSAAHMANLSEQCFSRNWMHRTLWVNDPDCLIMSDAIPEIMDPAGVIHKSPIKKKFYRLNNIYVRASGGMVLSGDYVGKYTDADIARLNRILNTDYTAAEFDDALEIGTKKTKSGTEYFIFNRKALWKQYEITVASGVRVIDMYSGMELKVKHGHVRLHLSRNAAAWVKICRA